MESGFFNQTGGLLMLFVLAMLLFIVCMLLCKLCRCIKWSALLKLVGSKKEV